MGRGTGGCSPRSPIGWGVVCLLPTRPLGKPTHPTPPPPDPVRGRSEEAGEGKPLPFLGTQELRRQLRLTFPAFRGGDADARRQSRPATGQGPVVSSFELGRRSRGSI